GDGIRQVVAAPVRQRIQMPVALDELEHGSVVAIAVDDPTAPRVRRHDDHRDTWPITEEIDRLEEPRVPVAASLVEGDEDRRFVEQAWTLLHVVDDPIDQSLEDVELRACRVSIVEAVRLEI